MSNDLLNRLKEQSESLTPQEKQELAKFLTEQTETDRMRGATDAAASETDPEEAALRRAERMAWLKANREEYAGQYVALDGDRLVGHGSNIREAREQAVRQGVERPFLVHVSSASDAPFGGW